MINYLPSKVQRSTRKLPIIHFTGSFLVLIYPQVLLCTFSCVSDSFYIKKSCSVAKFGVVQILSGTFVVKGDLFVIEFSDFTHKTSICINLRDLSSCYNNREGFAPVFAKFILQKWGLRTWPRLIWNMLFGGKVLALTKVQMLVKIARFVSKQSHSQ